MFTKILLIDGVNEMIDNLCFRSLNDIYLFQNPIHFDHISLRSLTILCYPAI